jgi:hypothetical protein
MKRFASCLPDAQQLRQVADHLHVAAHRELFHREERLRALGHHLGPGDAVEARVGLALAHGTDQRRPEHVARGLAGHDGRRAVRSPDDAARGGREEVDERADLGVRSAVRASSAFASARSSPDL